VKSFVKRFLEELTSNQNEDLASLYNQAKQQQYYLPQTTSPNQRSMYRLYTKQI
jgi:uncharacterized protein YeaO (DUF488 family)